MPRGSSASYLAQYRAGRLNRTAALRGVSRGAALASRRRPRRVYSGASGETKYFDQSIDFTIPSAADWTGTEVTCTNYIDTDGTTVTAHGAAQSALIPTSVGTGYGQVVANRYKLKKIRIKGRVRGTVIADGADAAESNVIRLVLVQDLNPLGTQMQGETIFSDQGNAQVCNFSFQQMGQVSNGFKILKDITLVSHPQGAFNDAAATGSTSFESKYFKFDVNFKDLQVHIKAGSATPTVAQLSDCNVFLLVHGSAAGNIIGCARAYYEG